MESLNVDLETFEKIQANLSLMPVSYLFEWHLMTIFYLCKLNEEKSKEVDKGIDAIRKIVERTYELGKDDGRQRGQIWDSLYHEIVFFVAFSEKDPDSCTYNGYVKEKTIVDFFKKMGYEELDRNDEERRGKHSITEVCWSLYNVGYDMVRDFDDKSCPMYQTRNGAAWRIENQVSRILHYEEEMRKKNEKQKVKKGRRAKKALKTLKKQKCPFAGD